MRGGIDSGSALGPRLSVEPRARQLPAGRPGIVVSNPAETSGDRWCLRLLAMQSVSCSMPTPAATTMTESAVATLAGFPTSTPGPLQVATTRRRLRQQPNHRRLPRQLWRLSSGDSATAAASPLVGSGPRSGRAAGGASGRGTRRRGRRSETRLSPRAGLPGTRAEPAALPMQRRRPTEPYEPLGSWRKRKPRGRADAAPRSRALRRPSDHAAWLR